MRAVAKATPIASAGDRCLELINGTEVEVVIIGAGGFGREVFQYAYDTGRFNVVGFLDDRQADALTIPDGLPLLGSISAYEPSVGQRFLMAVGDPEARSKIAKRIQALGGVFETIVHPASYVASTARIGAGSIVAPFASVGASAVLAELSQVHFYASVAHDVRVGKYSALSPYAAVNGGGQLGDCAFLGTRATVNPLKSVGDHSKVAAGAVVYQDVPEWSLASGNPAKSRRLMSAPSVQTGA